MSTLAEFKTLALAYLELETAAKEAESKKNKQATLLKNTFGAYLRASGFPPETTIRYKGRKYGYIPGSTSVIDPAGWLRLFREGRLTEAQFLEALSVGKEAARSSAGQDVVSVLEVSRPTKGTDPKWAPAEASPDAAEWEIDAPGHEIVTAPADSAKKSSAVILRGEKARASAKRPVRRLPSK
jgi:hypothetical protein